MLVKKLLLEVFQEILMNKTDNELQFIVQKLSEYDSVTVSELQQKLLNPYDSQKATLFVQRVVNEELTIVKSERPFKERYPVTYQLLLENNFQIVGGKWMKVAARTPHYTSIEKEIFSLLDFYEFEKAKKYLEDAIFSYKMGLYPSANMQLKKYVIETIHSVHRFAFPTHDEKETYRTQMDQLLERYPTLLEGLTLEQHERSFIDVFLRRIEPGNAHPGFSTVDDTTLQFQFVLNVSVNILRNFQRLDQE